MDAPVVRSSRENLEVNCCFWFSVFVATIVFVLFFHMLYFWNVIVVLFCFIGTYTCFDGLAEFVIFGDVVQSNTC